MFEDVISSSLLAPVAIAFISASAGFFFRGGNRRETETLKRENYRLKHLVDVMIEKTGPAKSR